MTGYMVTLPKNKTELFCWIEADRMANRVLREFFSEREVVTEERRMRYDNRPIGTYWERLNSLFYVANPYRLPTIGWASDIQAYTRAKLEDHVKRFYTPDNALMVFVGNVDTTQTFNMVKKYFSDIPRAAKPIPQVVTREPAPIGQTRFTMRSPAQPRIDMLWHVPGYHNSDLYALDIAGDVLSGKSGRLYQKLINEKGLCTSIDADLDMKLTDGSFEISATLKAGVSPDTVEHLILDELARLSKDPPSKSEIERVTNNMTMDFVTRLKSLEGLSDELARFERLGTYRDLFTYPDSIAAVKPETIPLVLKKYLVPDLMTVGTMLAEPGAKNEVGEEGQE